MSAPGVREAVHRYFMQGAIELARRGWYTTRPNPRVGCILVADERIIGEGWHERAGEGHAERRALDDAAGRGHATRGATAYVTLEPCSHVGRTAPCTEALIEAGVSRVVIGAGDPNPAVDGRGVSALRAAGIDVVTGVLADRCRELNPGFNRRMTSGRPRVRVKLAMSLDGRTAAANGESQWITGEAARADVHRLRAESGAVLVGRGTRQADDPSLTVRLDGEWPQPLRVVVDTHLEITPAARMLEPPGAVRIFTASADDARIDALERAGAAVERVALAGEGLDLPAVLDSLGAQEINDVLVEAGPTLAGSLAEAGCVDEYLLYMAPMLIGDTGRGLVHLPGANRLADARPLEIIAVEPVGSDWRIRARPAAADNRN
ncbi:diaminohydroxyphosphoribosylaminopyrimidine deaminase [Salinisphaera orenii MK-B5]|uniref:Riboflavin biosynthesis protein RibD n=1 Tax=Salinisphaera orenii MK-B5 TaxID=856730 RepID=A0A423PUI1_9GAMM|nr:bifunctional diaminohydroxyphosphoribosylaminopyrimidine deaminase/5-amino-6-(5-phosphoribosylamino)uracil reductase RibD [Salinisphaera orenii]ROO29224.1 diaminohydroxyphosphoribosylaminopyrimidine deaminase [Salinisphaera orenii MK-B5]